MSKSPDIIQKRPPGRIVFIAEKELHDLYHSIPLNGVNVDVCAPKGARNFLKVNQVDLILLDLGSETGRGLDLLRQLKALYPGIPVIFLTEDPSREVVVKAFRSGARDFIGKPADFFELQISIECILKIKRTSQERRSPILMLKFNRKEKFTPAITTDQPANILRAIKYIEGNLSKKISLEELARKVYLSKYHFCRLFSRHVGMAPMTFTSWMRIKRAKEYLKRKDLNVSTIALEVGFNDLGAFIRQFKKHAGVTPTAYRSSMRDSNPV